VAAKKSGLSIFAVLFVLFLTFFKTLSKLHQKILLFKARF
jgi:hypothetical protein